MVVVGVEDHVLGEVEVEDQAVALAVLGNVGHAGMVALPGAGVGDVLSVERIDPEMGSMIPVMASTSSVWPLPWTPAIPTISPDSTVKLTLSTARWLRLSTTTRSRTSSIGPVGLAGSL
jgi:hypothetical protein